MIRSPDRNDYLEREIGEVYYGYLETIVDKSQLDRISRSDQETKQHKLFDYVVRVCLGAFGYEELFYVYSLFL